MASGWLAFQPTRLLQVSPKDLWQDTSQPLQGPQTGNPVQSPLLPDQKKSANSRLPMLSTHHPAPLPPLHPQFSAWPPHPLRGPAPCSRKSSA